MEDDMMFCQKCGTKFEAVLSTAQSDIEVKIAKMKKYNLVIDSSSMSWQYVHDDFERAGNILVKQNQMCHELQDLIVDILSNSDDKIKDLVEREVYTYILDMGRRMCLEGAKMFADYSGYKELFDQGSSLVQMGRLSPEQFIGQIQQVDIPYKGISGLQGLNAFELKEKLDENIIYNNLEFKELTKKFAQAFNDMILKEIKRHTDFFLSPGIDHINTNWDMYVTILKGLPQSVIDTLDESGWKVTLDDQEKNHNGGEFKREFLRKRDQQRDAQRKKEQEIEDKQYWASHPNELKQLEENQKKIAEIQTSVDVLDEEICSLKNDKKPLDEKKANVEAGISDKKQKIEKLGKKIFGKKKAEEEIQILNGEINGLNQELQTLCEQIETAEKPISDKKNEKSELEREIRRIKQENAELRNK
ncbi:MAG: hypothetical protein HDR29_01480 [Lachnospiraceae bacterium]|nr:hypothetical protein [Lachnospiraceae bacterium]